MNVFVLKSLQPHVVVAEDGRPHAVEWGRIEAPLSHSRPGKGVVEIPFVREMCSRSTCSYLGDPTQAPILV